MRLRVNLLVFVAALVAVTAVSAQAQQTSGYVESFNTVSEAETTPQLNVYVHGPLKGKLGWSLWTLTSEGWSEGYVGLTYAPAKWVEVSSSIGLETDDNPLRTGHSVWLGKGRVSLLSLHEYGGSGYWYRYLGTFQATKTVAVGVNTQRFIGTGPYAQVSIGKVILWGTYAIGDGRGVVGARFNF